MKWALSKKSEQYQIDLTFQPENYFSLKMAPDEMEPELHYGEWLVLLVAVWSMPDLKAIDLFEKANRPNWCFGIRPFEDHEENQKWCTTKEKYGSPIWLYFNSGVLVKEKCGLLTEEALRNWLDTE